MKSEVKTRRAWALFKGMILTLYLKSHKCKVGKNLKCKQFPLFRSIPNGNIILGDNVNIGYRVTFDVQNRGILVVGCNANLTQDIMISAAQDVHIGDNVLIAENVSIRDADHRMKLGEYIRNQELNSKPIYIHDDVWIGAGVRVLKGAVIKRGCVIASNSVVLSKTETTENTIYGGIPIRFIRTRK